MKTNKKRSIVIAQLAIVALLCLCPCLAFAQGNQEAPLGAGQAVSADASVASRSHALAVQAGEIDSIMYTPKEAITLVEGRDVKYADEARGRALDVDCDFPCDFDTLTVVYTDFSSKDFKFNVVSGNFESEDKDEIPLEHFDVKFENIDGTAWSEGNVREAQVRYMPGGKLDESTMRCCKLDVTLEKNPVKSISYKPIKGYSPVYFTDSLTKGISEDEVRFWPPSFVDGDKLTVTYAKGGSTTYTYMVEDNVFRAGEEELDASAITWYDYIEADETGIVREVPAKSSVMYYSRKYAVPVRVFDPSEAGNDVRLDYVENIGDADITLSAESLAYNGVSRRPAVTVVYDEKELTKNVDFVVKYSNNINATADAGILVRGIGEYRGETHFNFEIRPISLSKIRYELSKRSFAYNGKVQKPSVKSGISMMVGGKNRILRKDIDFTVKYSNAKSSKVGTYYVWLVGKGNYKGCSKKISYTIRKKR